MTSPFGRALLIGVALALGGTSGTAAAQTDEVELAALRAQFDQIRTLVGQFDERLRAIEARQHHTAPSAAHDANGTGVAGVNGSGAPANPVAPTPPPAAPPPRITPEPPAGVATTAATPDRHSWRQVASGATAADVARLLGQPTTTFQLAGKTVWYYYYPAKGAGSVFFDSTGHASSVQSPSAGW